MLKQLIGQVQEILDLYGSPPPTIPIGPPPDFFYLQPRTLLAPPPQLSDDRWCFSNPEDKDDCYSLVTKTVTFNMLEPGNAPLSKKSRNDEKLDEISCSNETMEPIWKGFPEDLYEVVIARLPVAAFFRFRSVCRKWNSLLTSDSFSSECARLPQVHPWFYTIAHENINVGAMYDPTLKKWHHPIVPARPTKTTVLPVAAAGGLVCFLDIENRSLYVCNPLTQSCKELPARPVRVWSRVAIGMTLNDNLANGSYRVMWVGSNGEHEVYDSRNDNWTSPGSMPGCVKLNFRSRPVVLDGVMYFLRSDLDGVVSYDVESGVWKQFLVPVPRQLGDHTLAECGGRILLVGLLTKNAATCVYVWELQKMSLLWKEVDRMPNVWCLEIYGKHVKMSCLGNRGLVMLSLRSRTMNWLVTYDGSKKEWVMVPGCVHPRDRKRLWVACGVAFHPSLTAVA